MADDKAAPSAASQQSNRSQAGPTRDTETADRSKKRPLKGAALDEQRRLGTSTEGQSEEYKRLGLNPRLDNRTGDQRPVLAEQVKPQQIDGPEVGHFAEHAEKFAHEAENVLGRVVDGDTYGMKSEGPHGRGPHGVTVGDAHGQPVPAEGDAGDEKDPRNPA